MPVRADDRVQTIPPGEDTITVLREGEKAPYTGQLFDNPTALRWGNWLLQYKFRWTQDVEYQKRLASIEVDYWKKLLALEQDKYKKVTDDYQKRVADEQLATLKAKAEADNPPFYKTAWFGFITGIILTGAVVGAGVGIGIAASK